MITLTDDDFRVVKQKVLDIRLKLEVYDRFDNYIDEITGNVINGSGTIDAESDIRRTFTVEVHPDYKSRIIIDEQGYIWVDKFVRISVGIVSERDEVIRWWKFGKFVFSNTNTTYDAINNKLTINCSDLMATLDGSKNGELGQLSIQYPAYKEYKADAEDIFYTQTVSYTGNTYYLTIDGYTMYTPLDYILFTIPNNNFENSRIQINSLYSIPIVDKYTLEPVDPGVLQAGLVYSFFISNDQAVLTSHESIPTNEDGTIADGKPISSYIIRDAVLTTVGQLGRIPRDTCNVDDIGEYDAMPLYNTDWETYREQWPEWNRIPFDQEFSSGTTVLNILTTFRDLYPNYEAYFDEEGNFCMNMIPSGDEDEVVLQNNFFQPLYISENTSIDLSSIRNVCHVWGQVLEPDYFATSSVYTDNTYSATIEGYEDEYMTGDQIAITVSMTNEEAPMLNINEFGAIPIIDDDKRVALEADKIKAGQTYVLKIRKKYVDGEYEITAALQGQWQVQGICALVASKEGTDEIYHTTSGTDVRKYSEEYFRDVYACPSVLLRVIPTSPFTCQKIGEYMDVYTDEKNITSDSLALQRGDWEIYKQARLQDSITLVTTLVPFADVNIKVRYRRHDLDSAYPYIVKNISHNFEGGTTTWQLMRFYPLYERNHGYTHNQLKNHPYTYDELTQFTYEQLNTEYHEG